MADAALNDGAKNRQEDGRSCLRIIVACLLVIAFTTFSIAASDRCYANDIFYGSLWGLLGLLGILLALKLSVEKVSNNPAVILALVFSPIILLFYYALLSFLIFTTSSEPVQFQTQVINSRHGRGCRTTYWTLYNKPIHREIQICGDGLVSGTGSSGAMSVTEKVGPFGAYIQHVDKIR